MINTRNVLLWIHIAGAAAWLGANFSQFVLAPWFTKHRPDAESAWVEASMMLGQRYYGPAGAVIALTGIGLVVETTYDWSAGFVALGIVVVIIGGVTGVVGFTPLMRKQLAAIEASDRATATAMATRVRVLAAVDTLLVLVAIFTMVGKWQA